MWVLFIWNNLREYYFFWSFNFEGLKKTPFHIWMNRCCARTRLFKQDSSSDSYDNHSLSRGWTTNGWRYSHLLTPIKMLVFWTLVKSQEAIRLTAVVGLVFASPAMPLGPGGTTSCCEAVLHLWLCLKPRGCSSKTFLPPLGDDWPLSPPYHWCSLNGIINTLFQ